ncbi:MAG: ABC transporter substrate-binding protein [Gammaproteobacteria bacterium]|nr:ABC transporter substrate-binding protein [Gammaproteobacteria bacterium]
MHGGKPAYRLALACICVVLLLPGTARALNYGQPGDPVHLVVGYQPYYTEAWSAVVMRGRQFYAHYLPAGSTVSFYIGDRGLVLVQAIRSGRIQIGYFGDIPAVLSASGESPPARIVAVSGTSFTQCSILLVRRSAPQFPSSAALLHWLNGKRIAVPMQSCSERFLRDLLAQHGIHPGALFDQNLDTITAGLSGGALDAAAVWQPAGAQLAALGDARIAASGADFNWQDGGFLLMRADLIQQRPDIVAAWLRAELDAQRFLADPANSNAVINMAQQQTFGYSREALWNALYAWPTAAVPPDPVIMQLDFGLTGAARSVLARTAAFLERRGTLPPGADKPSVYDAAARQILAAEDLAAPIGRITPQPRVSGSGQPRR